ncbi:unnamed protein product [Heterobilharzia americana]|nr:unnamed protein product [Heterobilharzia americana]
MREIIFWCSPSFDDSYDQNRGPHGVSDDPSTVLSTGFKSDENTVRSLAHKQSFTQGKKQSSYFCFMFHSQE